MTVIALYFRETRTGLFQTVEDAKAHVGTEAWPQYETRKKDHDVVFVLSSRNEDEAPVGVYRVFSTYEKALAAKRAVFDDDVEIWELE